MIIIVSNIGTFLLYGMSCILCVIAFAGVVDRALFNTVIAPVLGAILNVLMLIGVLYFAITGSGSGRTDTIIVGIVCIAWLVIGFVFLYIRVEPLLKTACPLVMAVVPVER